MHRVEEDSPGWLLLAVSMLCALHVGLVSRVAYINSPNLDELAHLPAGISHWELGRFSLYCVNPPAVRMIAALPILPTDAVRDWTEYRSEPRYRSEFFVGKDFVKNNGVSIFSYFFWARIACIPFSLLGCLVAYKWARQLYGWRAGLFALALYSFEPNMIAWAASITPDAGAASTGLFALWRFWSWNKTPTWNNALIGGAALGLALLTKSTWIFLLVTYPIVAFGFHWRSAALLKTGLQTATIIGTGLYILNLGYGFEGSFKPLGQYQFISDSLSGDSPDRNRFSGTIMNSLPVPFPEYYVRGIDVQKHDFERGKWSYLRGEQKRGGWWYYYLYAFLVKNTLGFQLLLIWATISYVRERFPTSDLWLLLPVLLIFLLTSSQTGFNRYYRYVLPAIPFAFIWCSRLMHRTHFASRKGILVSGLLLVSIVEMFIVFPHVTSSFNVAVGGPLGGPKHLLDGNIDWGQDLLELKRWVDKHPEAKPLHVAYFSEWDIDPRIAGIEYQPVPEKLEEGEPPELKDGWYAVSVNYVYGLHYFENDTPKYAYFQQLKPIDRAGYSIYIYRVANNTD